MENDIIARPAMPQLNKPAPAFTAPTTHGDISLSNYKGKWLILFSHPADFTPVCTTEFMAFAKAAPDFKKLNCELLGLSIKMGAFLVGVAMASEGTETTNTVACCCRCLCCCC